MQQVLPFVRGTVQSLALTLLQCIIHHYETLDRFHLIHQRQFDDGQQTIVTIHFLL